VFVRNLPALLQFREGAQELLSLGVSQSAVEVLKKLFVGGDQPIDFLTFRQLYSIDYSEQGSNNRPAEEDTVYSFDCCLQKCEGL